MDTHKMIMEILIKKDKDDVLINVNIFTYSSFINFICSFPKFYNYALNKNITQCKIKILNKLMQYNKKFGFDSSMSTALYDNLYIIPFLASSSLYQMLLPDLCKKTKCKIFEYFGNSLEPNEKLKFLNLLLETYPYLNISGYSRNDIHLCAINFYM